MYISHEVPFALLEQSKQFNDYDYALVHLYEEYPEYLQYYKSAVEQGRHVILDNSVFELETAFDSDRFAHWIEETKPTEYIIPDVLDDALNTMKSVEEWNNKYGGRLSQYSNTIGVIQGASVYDALMCYRFIAPLVDKVAISFNCKFYESMFSTEPKLVAWMKGRQAFIDMLIESEFFNRSQPFHLLGCSYMAEFRHYTSSKYNFIKTIDTSNPIVFALSDVKCSEEGMDEKISTKLIEFLQVPEKDINMDLINHNVKLFRACTIK
jgi:hypothetical protein